uniref:FAD/NAD(P)-binding domain-containing protein n=1 Tax=Mucochytrium quahogii TaxID=96639 RepID=A0A7S2S2E9_9STRA|mmetsp:Transcript_4258/g.6263  ORF Transcript_4258/g.6263 Transcript_4258/m.6263 type:complete len:517 (-) Transcript_4258:287-1837(-)
MENVQTIVVGCGMSGILAGMKLKKAGLDDFVILEKSAQVGGTWSANTYPGICCDVKGCMYLPLHYLPGFVPTRIYSSGAEILEFLKQLVETYGLYTHIQFNCTVASARFDTSSNRWTIETSEGRKYRSKYVIFANGPLSKPKLPDFPGLDTFHGEWCHSARYDHNIKLKGKRVGVVGTGASAIQIVPECAKLAKELVVFQRSAPYCWRRDDGPLAERDVERLTQGDLDYIYKLRNRWNIEADDVFWENYNDEERNDAVRNMYTAYMKSVVKDKGVAEKLIPDYPIGCKRPLISDDYLETFNLKNTRLVADKRGVTKITKDGVVVGDGEQVKVDVLIFATGFETGWIRDCEIHGRKNTLTESYNARGGIHSIFGMCASGFPNLFMILAPQGWTAHANTSESIDVETDWVVHMISGMESTSPPLETVEARPDAEDWWRKECSSKADNSVWTKCASWYVDSSGTPLLYAGKWGSYVALLCSHSQKSFTFSDCAHRSLSAESTDIPPFTVKPYQSFSCKL